MDYQITCVCGHRFFLSDQEVTSHVTCPACGRSLIPVITPNQTATPATPPNPEPAAPSTPASPQPGSAVAASVEATKRCPFCGEVILAIAKKCKHCGEFLDRAHPDAFPGSAANTPHPVVTPSHPTAPTTGTVEAPIFAMSVSQWDNFWKYLVCGIIAVGVPFGTYKIGPLSHFTVPVTLVTLMVMAVVAAFFYYSTRNSRCIVRPMRIETEVGVLSKDLTSLDLFRVTDLELKQGLVERMLGIGTIRVVSNDPNTPELIIYQIPKARQVFRYLQQQVPIAARQRGAVYLER